MHTNSENPNVGKRFQELACKSLTEYFRTEFDLEVSVPVGNPAKGHKFDCVSTDGKIVVECKCYVWTEGGNPPSAKIRSLNEAVLFMSFLSKEATKIICMAKDSHPRRGETLAEYFVRLYGHLLRDVKVFEVDEQGRINVVRE